MSESNSHPDRLKSLLEPDLARVRALCLASKLLFGMVRPPSRPYPAPISRTRPGVLVVHLPALHPCASRALQSAACALWQQSVAGLPGSPAVSAPLSLSLSRRCGASPLPARALQPTQSPYEVDLLHPLPSVEASKHKLKRLVQTPNSFFMDVKCPGCFNM